MYGVFHKFSSLKLRFAFIPMARLLFILVILGTPMAWCLQSMSGKANYRNSFLSCSNDGVDLVYIPELSKDATEDIDVETLADNLAAEALEDGCEEPFYIGLNRKRCSDEYWWQGGSKTNDGAPSFQNVRGPSITVVSKLVGSELGSREKCIVFSPQTKRFYSTCCTKRYSVCCGEHQESTPELLPDDADEGFIQTWNSPDDLWLRYITPDSPDSKNFAMLTRCMGFAEAAETCRSINGRLATIRTEEEQTVVNRMVKYAKGLIEPYFEVSRAKGAWVGAALVDESIYHVDGLVPEEMIASDGNMKRNANCVGFSYKCDEYGKLKVVKCSRRCHVLCECQGEACDLS